MPRLPLLPLVLPDPLPVGDPLPALIDACIAFSNAVRVGLGIFMLLWRVGVA